ncbi:hypothetical protein [Paraurantiacibacter namhicola]|uniref:Sulfotransferase domain protein n=1 Tax=Paraurantiacibacter namhicola TaxID=645517 RepID=A0A1C7D904_9SPHN|nr:hypothetical protein [Paraurantiacibacter namhicola]ANU07915.1 hypothetical protein A6F65_01616 [Paraurantiacibacter namhicola]
MTIDMQSISTDPALYLYNFHKEFAQFLEMPRDAFHKSVFLDERIQHGNRKMFRAPIDALANNFRMPALTSCPVNWIFHVAQCGSTLLARSLDHPGESLVLREPAAIRQIGVIASAGADRHERLGDPGIDRLLSVTMALLGKRFESSSSVVVKANVPVNFIAPEIMARNPEAGAVLMYFPLAEYIAAIMRTEAHERWVTSIYDEMRIGESEWVSKAPPANTAQKAAALWFVQMKIFDAVLQRFPNARSLNASQFFAEPQDAIAASAKIFGIPMTAERAREIADGELFQTYAKNPALDYDPQVRLAREAEAKGRLSSQIEDARNWVMGAKDRHGLIDELTKPLGEAGGQLIS